MDFPNGNRAEALRWFNIAERLLGARDLFGAKSFAIRARDSDPIVLDAANRVIAVADTILASESPIINQFDWYGILQLPRPTQSVEHIASQYRRLALVLNPETNHAAYADHAFKLVTDAWFVLSNPLRKALYDNELNLYLKNDVPAAGSAQKQKSPEKPPPPPPPPPQRQPPQQQQQQPPQQLPAQLQQESRPTQPPRQRGLEQPNQPAGKSLNAASDGKVTVEEERGNASNVTEPTQETPPTQEDEGLDAKSTGPTFWTACPYCFNLFEYPEVYEDCVLKCQNCHKAFQAVKLSPPPISDKEDYYCCWGFIPLGISSNVKQSGRNWNPISSMFVCPLQGQGKAKKEAAPKKSSPRFYYHEDDDDDVYVEVSNPSGSSDEEWESGRRKKKAKRGSAKKNEKKASTERVKKGSQVSGGNENGGGIEESDGAKFVAGKSGFSNASKADSSKKGSATSNAKRHKGKGATELGKLDLNVEFSNEVEEPSHIISEGNETGNGVEDNIEGIGFFEGLDEFLSSLPILNVVDDDKVKTS